MATYFVDGERDTNGTGASDDEMNAFPTATSGSTYLLGAGRRLNGGASPAVNIPAGVTDVIVGAYDPVTKTRITSGSTKALLTVDSAQFTVRLNTNAHRCELDMLDVTNPSGVSQAQGIHIGNTTSLVVNDATIRKCRVHDIVGTSTSNGINFRGSRLTVEDSEIFGVPNDGIFGYGEDVRIIRNLVYDVDRLDVSGDCIQLAGDATLGCSRPYIEDNYLRNPHGNKQNIIVQDTTGGSSGGRIAGNDCEIVDGGSNQCVYVEIDGIRVVGNRLRGGHYGVFVSGSDIVLTGNLLIDLYTGIVLQTSGCTGTRLYTNTAVRCAGYGLYLADDTTASALDNILLACGVGLAKHGSAAENYNGYYQNTTDQANTGGSAAWGANNVMEDLLLDSSYRPIPESSPGAGDGSPCIGAGIYIPGARDYAGRKLRNPPDIGARQYYAPHGVVSPPRVGVAVPRSGVSMKRNAVLNRSSRG